MRRSFKPALSLGDPRKALQTLVGVLIALNLVALWFVFRPLGGSAEDLEQEARSLRTQLAQRRSVLKLVYHQGANQAALGIVVSLTNFFSCKS